MTQQPSRKQIIKSAVEDSGATLAEVQSSLREARVVKVRNKLCLLLAEAGYSRPQIGASLNMDQSSVTRAIRRAEKARGYKIEAPERKPGRPAIEPEYGEDGPCPREAVITRIRDRTVVDENGCWVWQGSTSGDGPLGGYGKMRVHGQSSLVHRVMYVCMFGYLPTKKQVDHKCCNRLCCNPDHLQAVTPKKNCKLRNKRNEK